MPSKKKKYNARFPAGRIKRIMQSDEEIGKVAQAVPVIIYFIKLPRTLELFVESLLTKTLKITNSRNAKTLSPSHMKQCIMAESRFDFLRELVKNVPDISVAEEAANENDSSPEQTVDPDTPYDLSMPSTSFSRNIPAVTSSGNHTETSHLRNGGGDNKSQSLMNTSTVTSTIPSFSDSSAAPMDENSQSYMKRQLNLINRLRRRLETQADSTTTNSHNSGIEISVPSSVIRHTSSELAATAISSDDTANDCTQILKRKQNYSPAEATQLAIDYTKQHHEMSEIEITTNNSIKSSNTQTSDKNNQNQPNKNLSSTPANLSKDSGQSQMDQKSNTIHPKSKQIAIPAPIVHIDFCSKPVVKIDYSNLTAIDSAVSDLRENSKTNQSVNLDSSTVSSTVATAAITTTTITSSSMKLSPVINIDLSNMVATPPLNSKNQPVITLGGGSLTKSTYQPNPTVTLASNKNTFLELDEDYDNI